MPVREYDELVEGQTALAKIVTEAFNNPDPKVWDAKEDDLHRIWSRQGGQNRRDHNRSQQRVKREAARKVIAKLYPRGISEPATLPNKLLCKAVAPYMSYPVSDDTILRAADRK